jgi:phosphatidylserine decarboxylase
MITRYGYGICITFFIIFVFVLLFFLVFPDTIPLWSVVLTGLIAAFNLYFFRDPQRHIPAGDNFILSPADGTVLRIEDVDEQEYFKAKVRRISIFLSVFNVHVNRIPISGSVDFLKYRKGKFVAAFEHKASEENEMAVIGIRNEGRRLLFTQIAGIIARRIIYELKDGDQVTAGERFGMIRYGSRVDIYVPPEVRIGVKIKDRVVGGETIIGEYK